MNFESGYIYHIYNRGNNRGKIFFREANYLFFLRKARKELAPHFHFLAYCLMPNHFHLLVQVKEINSSDESLEGSCISPLSNSSDESLEGSCVSPLSNSSDELGGLSLRISNKIGVLLRSYTRAINKQERRTGSLFQQKTKAKCLNTKVNSKVSYVETCFNYIHQNPVNSGLVNLPEDWKYSSFQDYAALRKGNFCNIELASEILNLDGQNFIQQSNVIFEEIARK